MNSAADPNVCTAKPAEGKQVRDRIADRLVVADR
jgi:hypothetical protein